MNFLAYVTSFPFGHSFQDTRTYFRMARTKQATPLRREPSSEYTSKADQNGTPTRISRNMDKEANGTRRRGSVSLTAESVIEALAPEARKEAGALQFLVAVGGIYGSL
jgi:solute carrier family 35 (UDP-galactose transporter), member B1